MLKILKVIVYIVIKTNDTNRFFGNYLKSRTHQRKDPSKVYSYTYNKICCIWQTKNVYVYGNYITSNRMKIE